MSAVAAGVVVLTLAVIELVASRPSQAATPDVTAHPPASTCGWVVDRDATYRVAVETGPSSINRTDRSGDVYGADLGHMFLYHGHIMMVFGDTFGAPSADPFFSVAHADWRSNTMAVAPVTTRPTAGLVFSAMVTDRANHAKELLSAQKVVGSEETVIPTYGIAVGERMYLYYMSVREFDQPGHWTLNHSGIAYSDNGGISWTKSPVVWPGTSNFGQVALVNQGGYLYVYGIPGGRYGGLQLARVPRDRVLTMAAYEYWNGSSWRRNAPSAARTIVPGPVGEMSVRYNSYYRKWLMMYLVDPTGEIVLRTSDALTGPWSAAQVVVTAKQYPQLYAPYITPTFNDTRDIWFNMSMYGPYQVSMMHTALNPKPATAPLPTSVLPVPAPSVAPPRPTGPHDHGRGATPAP